MDIDLNALPVDVDALHRLVHRGAKAGDVLEVRIKAIKLNYEWGYNMIRRTARGS